MITPYSQEHVNIALEVLLLVSGVWTGQLTSG